MSDVVLIERFIAAWQRGDLDAVVACLAEDVVYSTSGRGGAAVNFHGRADVAAAFADQLGDDPDLVLGPVVAVGGRALCDWWYPAATNGTTLRGVDVYTVANGLITLKDVYAKLEPV